MAESRASLAESVSKSIESAGITERDKGVATLALQYAQLIDEAVYAQKYRKMMRLVMRAVDRYDGEDSEEVAEAYGALAAALSQHSVSSDLGPKLLASLTSLGLTPAARSDTGKATPNVSAAAGKRDELQARRADRQRRASSMDATP
jgi:hypothetical protein